MKAIRHLLKDYLKDQTFQSGLNMAKLLESWQDLLGEYLATRLIPVSFEKGILYCQVQQSTLVQEFSFVEYKVLAKLKHIEGGSSIQGIRLVTRSPIRRQEKKALDKMSRAQAQHLNCLTLRKSELIDEQIQASIESQTRSITDANLQHKAQKLMQAMARRQAELRQHNWKSCESCQSFFEPLYSVCPYCRLSDG